MSVMNDELECLICAEFGYLLSINNFDIGLDRDKLSLTNNIDKHD